MKKILTIHLPVLLLSFFILVPQTFASQTVMEVTPKGGSFDKPFPVSIMIDGKGDVFNAAESTVILSPNLSVKDVTLGDCNLSYLTTPNVDNLSFSGVILSGSSKKCTVYRATVIPTAKGKATISLSKSAVRRYGDAVNVLTTSTNGSYTLTGVSSTKPQKQSEEKANGLYTVSINLVAKENEPLQDAIIILASPSATSPLQTKTNQAGEAQFSSIKQGIYQATVTKNGKEVAKTIVNVKGSNPNLTFGINLENQKNNPLLANTNISMLGFSPLQLGGILLVGITIGIVISILITKVYAKRKKE